MNVYILNHGTDGSCGCEVFSSARKVIEYVRHNQMYMDAVIDVNDVETMFYSKTTKQLITELNDSKAIRAFEFSIVKERVR